MCPRKTPTAKPKTLIIEKTGIYPAKSSRPKIKGIVKEKTIKFAKESFFVFVKFKFGTKNLRIGLNNLFTKFNCS